MHILLFHSVRQESMMFTQDQIISVSLTEKSSSYFDCLAGKNCISGPSVHGGIVFTKTNVIAATPQHIPAPTHTPSHISHPHPTHPTHTPPTSPHTYTHETEEIHYGRPKYLLQLLLHYFLKYFLSMANF